MSTARPNPASKPTKPPSRLRKIGLITAAIVLVGLMAAAVAYWLVVPGMARKMVRAKLDAVESKLGVDIETREVVTSGISGVTVRGFKVVDPASEQVVAEIGSISASVDAAELIAGNKRLSGLSMDDATLHVHRNADGSTNLEAILARRTKGDDGDEASDDAPKNERGAGASARVRAALRYFGGDWPDLAIHNAKIVFSADEGAKPWPARELRADTFSLDSDGQSAGVAAKIAIERGQAHPRWSLPERVDLEGVLRLPLEESTGQITLASPLEVVGVGPYPFLRLGIGGVSVDSDNTVSLEGLSVGVQGDAAATKLLSVERIAASFKSLSASPKKLRPLEVSIEKPVVTVHYDSQYGSGLNDLLQLTRAPIAGHVVGKTRRIIEAVAERKGIELEEEKKSGGLLAKLGQVDWTHFLADQAPQTVSITGAAIEVTDERPLALAHVDHRVALRDGYFKFSHRALNGELVFNAGFEARANGDEPRGKVDAKLAWNYRDHGLDLEARVDALSLPWLVQIADGDLADNVRSGTLRVDFDAQRGADESRLDFQGLVSVEDATFFASPVTEEPIEDLTASYAFEAHWDPRENVPEPKLLDERAIAVNAPAVNAHDRDDGDDNAAEAKADEPPKPRPPQRGALQVAKGHFAVNGVEGEFRPALFGLAGFKKMPARFDLSVEIPEVEVGTLFKAVPDAIKGPLTGAKMKGRFAWTLDAEVPLYDAGEMEWKSKPKLTNFELVSLPDQVDVRKMRDEFEMTIYDPTLKWKREVTIPRMRPVPLDWLVRHSGISAEEFEKRRKEREWPPRYAKGFNPDPDGDGIPNRLMPHKAPWPMETAVDESSLTSSADPTASPAPAPVYEPLHPPKKQKTPRRALGNKHRRRTGNNIPKDVTVYLDGEKKEHPYGPYTYVPLQYISPWVLRAAMTTEDNSFFEHHGFNWFALKDSVEDNLEAGGFVRGASTISMQLVKNVFLNRKKVLARKFQEAFLVWLMEDVVDIPKARILELYFNVIEYGPGIFGINDAAVHYFGKRPDKLTLTEVAWLVSIVPNPKKYHIYYERGQISDAWFRHMLRYVRVMQNRGRVTELEYELAKEQKPAFYKPADGEPLMRLDHDPEELDELKEEADSIKIPGLDDLFSP